MTTDLYNFVSVRGLGLGNYADTSIPSKWWRAVLPFLSASLTFSGHFMRVWMRVGGGDLEFSNK